MPTLDQALAEYGDAITPPPPTKGFLGAFVAGSFQVRVDTDPSLAWVRDENNQTTTAKHRGVVDLDTGDNNIPIELYIDLNGDLAIFGYDRSQAGAVEEAYPLTYLLTGNAVIRTIVSGVLTVGNESIVIVAAESGTSDIVDQVVLTGLARDLHFIADTGDTITFKHYVSGSDNVHLFGGVDIDITAEQMLGGYHDTVDFRGGAGGGGGAFTDLIDTFAYSGNGDKAVFVNTGATALEARDALPIAAKTRLVADVLYDSDELSSAATFDSGTLPNGYIRKQILVKLKASHTSAAGVLVTFDGDTTDSNYSQQNIGANHTTLSGSRTDNSRDALVAPASTSGLFGVHTGEIPFPDNTTHEKAILWKLGDFRTVGTDIRQGERVTEYKPTAAITRVQMEVNNATNTFAAGSRMIIIGWKVESIGGIAVSELNISATPTASELDSEFGSAASLPDGFAVFIDDAAGGTNEWLVWAHNSKWWGVQATELT